MTSPDKPQDPQGNTETGAEPTTVIAHPAAAGQSPGQPAREETANSGERPPAEPAASATAPAAAGPGAEPAAAEDEDTDTADTAEGVDRTSAVLPPWQRVTSDAQYLAERDGGPVPPSAVPPHPVADPEATAVTPPFVGSLAGAGAVPGAAGAGFGAGPVGAGIPPGLGASAGRPPMDLGALGSRPSPSVAAAGRRPGRGPRRASLQVRRVDPWSVLKLALVLSISLFFVWLVAVGVLYGVLDGMGVWDKLNGTYNDLVQGGAQTPGGNLISPGRVFGVAALIGAINVVLFTALATVSAFIYNVSADLAGGLEVTLSERE